MQTAQHFSEAGDLLRRALLLGVEETQVFVDREESAGELLGWGGRGAVGERATASGTDGVGFESVEGGGGVEFGVRREQLSRELFLRTDLRQCSESQRLHTSNRQRRPQQRLEFLL